LGPDGVFPAPPHPFFGFHYSKDDLRKRTFLKESTHEFCRRALLLKVFATVATVPRPEDTGIDAVGTLLRDDGAGMVSAENSFYVQFKSASDRTGVYEGHEVVWLKNLKLPLFIGSVNKEEGGMDLFSTHRLAPLPPERWQVRPRRFGLR
jgi:hypothetical protein